MKQKGFSVIAQQELLRMQDQCLSGGENELALEKERLIALSNKRTKNWKDTIENKKKMKDQSRFERFEKEEKKRRDIDKEEYEYQQKVRQE